MLAYFEYYYRAFVFGGQGVKSKFFTAEKEILFMLYKIFV